MVDKKLFEFENYFPYKDGVYDILGNDFIKKLQALPVDDTYKYNNEDLDYVAWKVYGIEDAYWIIGFYNNIIDPYNISNQTDILYIPALEDVIDLLLEYQQGN